MGPTKCVKWSLYCPPYLFGYLLVLFEYAQLGSQGRVFSLIPPCLATSLDMLEIGMTPWLGLHMPTIHLNLGIQSNWVLQTKKMTQETGTKIPFPLQCLQVLSVTKWDSKWETVCKDQGLTEIIIDVPTCVACTYTHKHKTSVNMTHINSGQSEKKGLLDSSCLQQPSHIASYVYCIVSPEHKRFGVPSLYYHNMENIRDGPEITLIYSWMTFC